jgi:hypothetical protein
MGKEEREQHRRDVAAYYRQNGQTPPKRYRDVEPGPVSPPPVFDPANPYAGVDRSRMTPAQREMLDFAQELIATRGHWREPGHKEEMLNWLDKYRNEHGQPGDNKSASHPTTGRNGMSHKEEIIGALVAARDEIEQGVVARGAQASALIDQVLQNIISTEQPLNSAAGYTAQAYQTSDLASYIGSLSSDMVETISVLHEAKDKVETYTNAGRTVVTFYNDTIAREQAVGQ